MNEPIKMTQKELKKKLKDLYKEYNTLQIIFWDHDYYNGWEYHKIHSIFEAEYQGIFRSGGTFRSWMTRELGKLVDYEVTVEIVSNR